MIEETVLENALDLDVSKGTATLASIPDGATFKITHNVHSLVKETELKSKPVGLDITDIIREAQSYDNVYELTMHYQKDHYHG